MPPENAAPLGTPLRAHRERLGLTQVQVADQLARLAWIRRKEHVGVNADMVSKWERGTKAVSPLYREMYCALFEMDGAALGFLGTAPEPVLLDVGAGAADVLEQLGPAVDQLGPTVLDAWKEEAMKRRTLLKLLGSTQPPWLPQLPAPALLPCRRPTAWTKWPIGTRRSTTRLRRST